MLAGVIQQHNKNTLTKEDLLQKCKDGSILHHLSIEFIALKLGNHL
jgi:hypothetical protein